LIAAGGVMLANNIDLTADNEPEIEDELIYAEELGNQVEIDSPLAVEDDFTVQKPVLAEADLPPVDDPFATPFDEAPPTEDGNTAVSDIAANAIGLALEGREAGTKKALLGRYGGNETTEAAVRLGLQWLARQQRKDGSWSLSGPYKGGVQDSFDNSQAATAMALLAFQGYGVTHTKGDFKKNVDDGWKWLLKEQDGEGSFFREGPFNHRYYTQGQCSIALCEILGMSKDEKFKEPAERAIRHLIKSQSPEGGWRYAPNADSDVSVTGWIVMALQSARMAKLEVPEDNLRQIERYLDRIAQQDGARYPYQRGGEIKLAMTAEAMLCRQYLGWRRSDPRMVDAMDWVTSEGNLISFERSRDAYFWYYATQAAHHMEGDWWKRWNGVMRQILPEQQIKRGVEAGSWDPSRPTEDAWARHGGRLYVTCLSIYMLEVYYRHLPIYTKVYTDLLKSGRTPGT
jgi:prenyltransferase beta subunit